MTEKHYDTHLEQALDIGGALLTKKINGAWRTLETIEEDEERASLNLWIVDRMRYYKPERAAVSTFVYQVFRQWAWERVQERVKRWGSEHLAPPVLDSDAEGLSIFDYAAEQMEDVQTPAPFSELAEELVAKFPERLQGSVRHVWGDGLNSKQAAPLVGVSEVTVRRNLMRARTYIADHPDEFRLVA